MSETAAEYHQFRDTWLSAVMRNPSFTGNEKAVLAVLLMHRNRKTGLAWPSAVALAKDTTVTDRTAKRALQKAEQLGYLKTVKHGTGGLGYGECRTSVRRFLIPTGDTTVPIGLPDGSESGDAVVPVGRTRDTSVPELGTHASGTRDTSVHLTPEGTPDREPLNKNHSPAAAGADRPDDEPKRRGIDYFTSRVEPLKRAAFTTHVENHGHDYADILTEFIDENEGVTVPEPGARDKWSKKFNGWFRDWANTHAA